MSTGPATEVPAPQPTAPAPTSTGEAERQGAADGFWGNFPNVPEDARTALEPHLRQVQGYVTQLEQKAAPFKNYTPDQVQGLKNFADQFDANPLQMFLAIGADLQRRGVIHEALDLEALSAVVEGRDPDEGADPNQVPGQVPQQPPTGEEIPEWARPMMEELQELRQERETSQRTQQEQREDAALQVQLDSIKNTLKESGVDEALLDDKRVLGLLIAHNGNPQAVIKAEMDYRTATLKGVVQPKPETKVRQDRVPAAPKPKTPSSRGDAFGKASAAAEQHLRAALKP